MGPGDLWTALCSTGRDGLGEGGRTPSKSPLYVVLSCLKLVIS